MNEGLAYALIGAVEVESAAFFEGQFYGDEGVVRGDAAGGDGEEEAFPGVGAEEGGGDVGVLEVEEGGGEGSEGWDGGCGEVD